MNTPKVSRIKKISDIPGLETFIHYKIDTEGNVYSLKNKKIKRLRPGWAKRRDGYLFVRLSNIHGQAKNFFVHRLVCMAFMAGDDLTLEVGHKNKNLQDNRVENLYWLKSKKDKYKKEEDKEKGLVLDEVISQKIIDVHIASIRKGLTVPDDESFLNKMLNDALNSYINQYGLRKVMTFR